MVIAERVKLFMFTYCAEVCIFARVLAQARQKQQDWQKGEKTLLNS